MINIDNYREEIRTIKLADTDVATKAVALNQLFERLCKEATQSEAMQFSTLFSRIVYIAQKHNVPKKTEWELQNFRVKVKEQRKNTTLVDQTTYDQSEQAILELCKHLSGENLTDNKTEFEAETTLNELDTKEREHKEAKDLIKDTLRVQILTIDKDKRTIQCAVEKSPGKEVTVRYDVSPDNDIFTPSVSLFEEGAQLNLIENTLDDDGHLIPKKIV